MTVPISDLNALPGLARKLLSIAGDERIFLFYGDMGSGKTTFIKAICKELGTEDVVSSPTFSIVNEYATSEGPVFHFDFYRLKSETEALDLGYEDYIYSGNYCFIEWPEKIKNLLPERACKIEIKVKDDGERDLILEKP